MDLMWRHANIVMPMKADSLKRREDLVQAIAVNAIVTGTDIYDERDNDFYKTT